MHGIWVVDKPEGITSFDVVRQVRRACGTRKVGHGGTLDPFATGVLPVAVGDGTRILEFLADGHKVYRAVLKLGVVTDTQDLEGQVLRETSIAHLNPMAVGEAFQQFEGPLVQVPPMFSALKHQGTPLYRLARAGQEVDRPGRSVTVHRLEIHALDLPLVTFEVCCSKGTYVRTLAHDIGERLGVGAHLVSLQRVESAPFRLSDAIDLDTLKNQACAVQAKGWFGLREALTGYPQPVVDASGLARLAEGIPPTLGQVKVAVNLAEGALVALVSDECLAAMARFAPLRLNEQRGDFELLKVFHRR